MKCIKCGSFAINENSYERVKGEHSNLCDPHYWQEKHAQLQTEVEALKQTAKYETDVAAQAIADFNVMKSENEMLHKDAKDWKALHMAVATGQSYWPNNWGQEVAIIAYALHLCDKDAAWQPIETAPKDGSMVLLCRNVGGTNPCNYRSVGEWCEDRYWTTDFADCIDGNIEDKPPTHWMPLPKPPIAGEAT
jgi:Protein of unknown function (DUF551)